MALFAVGSGCLTGLARYGRGLDQALVSRYTSFSTLFWIALSIAAHRAWQTSWRPGLVRLLLCALCLFHLSASWQSAKSFEQQGKLVNENLDRVYAAADGLLFRNAYATPVCASTRAQAMTGRYGFRTGVGTVGGGGGLNSAEVTIAEMLVGYSTGAYGKWGLASGGGGMGGGGAAMDPNNQGFDDYAGSTGSGIPDYFSWNKTINGSTSNTTTYSTTVPKAEGAGSGDGGNGAK